MLIKFTLKNGKKLAVHREDIKYILQVENGCEIHTLYGTFEVKNGFSYSFSEGSKQTNEGEQP